MIMATKPTVVFSEIKPILDQAIADWTTVWGGPPDLLGVHATTKFSWNTALELKNSVARGLPLIQPGVIGQNPPLGATANLVVALKTGVAGYPRMPKDGPYRTDAEIQMIIDWIDGGCQ
jgi:hypothetical protein